MRFDRLQARRTPIRLGVPLLGAAALLAIAGPLASWQAARPDRAPVSSAPQLTIARLQYGGGGDWYVGPSTLPNLLNEIRQRTGVQVAPQPVTVKATDASLWDYPMLFMSGHGNVSFTDEEAGILRRYLLSGGFLLADDCYGMNESFRREIKKIFPEKDLVELPLEHPIYKSMYQMPNGLPKVHEHDNKPPQGFGIFHEGRLVAFYVYESDIHDGWEDAQVHGDPAEVREQAFRMGVNIFLFVLAQSVG
jgi:hypothetical protein